MASTYTDNLNLELQAAGDNVDTWGDPTLNQNVFTPIDGFAGTTTEIALSSSNVTLTLSQWASAVFKLTGTLSANVNLSFPLNSGGVNAVGGERLIDNQTSGNFTVTVKTAAAGSTGVEVPQGYRSKVYSNATNVVFSTNSIPQALILNMVASATVGSDQNDYSVAATVSYLRLNVTSAASISGITNGTAGRILTVHNVGTANLTLLNESSLSTAANRFVYIGAITVPPNSSFDLQYDGTSSRWRPVAVPQAALMAGTYKNLSIVNGSSPTSIMAVTADAVVAEDTNGNTVRLRNVSVTPNISTSGANGLDTGSVAANTWYYQYVIYNPTTNTVAGLFSASATSPTMPSGYTFKVRVGAVFSNSSSQFLRIQQKGNIATYKPTSGSNTTAFPIIASSTAGTYAVETPTYSSQSISNVVPSTASQIGIVVMNRYATNAEADVLVAPVSGQVYGGVQSTKPPFVALAGSGQTVVSAWMPVEATSIGYVSDTAGGACFCTGWVDNL